MKLFSTFLIFFLCCFSWKAQAKAITTPVFNNPNQVIDYVEWGIPNYSPSLIAIATGIWTFNDYVIYNPLHRSLAYDGSGNRGGSGGNDNGGDCNSLTATVGTGLVTIDNIPADAMVEILGPGTDYALLLVCGGNCETTETVNNLVTGNYNIKIQTFNPYCYNEISVTVTENPESGNGGNENGGGSGGNENVGDCNSLTAIGGTGLVTMSNIPTGAMVEIFGPSTGYAPHLVCDGNCENTETVNNLVDGEYSIKIQTFAPYCFNEISATVTGNSGSGGNVNVGDCTSVTASGGTGMVTIDNIPAGAMVEILGISTGYAPLLVCNGNCVNTETVNNLVDGEYNIKIQTFDPYCYNEISVTVTGNPESGSGGNGNEGGGNGNEGDCTGVTVTGGDDILYVNNIPTGAIVNIVDPTTNSNLLLACNNDCGSATVIGFPAGVYNITVQTSNPDCFTTLPVTVTTVNSGGNCNDVTASGGEGIINIDNIPTDAVINVVDPNTNQPLQTICNGNCSSTADVDFPAGEYAITVQTLNPFCFTKLPVTVTPMVNNGAGNCNDVTISGGVGRIYISNIPAQISISYTASGSINLVELCNTNCDPTEIINNLSPGEYFVTVLRGNPFCFEQHTVIVTSSSSLGSRNAPMLDFAAFPAQREVALQWATNTGYKNDYYVMEKSLDGINFEALQRIDNLNTTDEVAAYNGIDPTPALGDNYYRIKQVFVDGSYEYTEVQNIPFNIDLDQLSMYPNPAEKELNFNFKAVIGKSMSIYVINNLGQVVKSMELDKVESNHVQLSLDNMANGFYQVLLQVENQKPITKKLIVEKLY